MEVPSANTLPAITLLVESILEASLTPSMFKNEKRLALHDLENADEDFDAACVQRLTAELFRSHPYALNPLGRKTAIADLTLAGLRKHYHKKMINTPWTIACLSGADHADLHARFADRLPTVFSTPTMQTPRLQEVLKPRKIDKSIRGEKACFALGFRTPGMHHPRAHVFELISGILAGSGPSSLFQTLREAQGLAYTVLPDVYQGTEAGYLSVFVNTSPRYLKKVQRMVRQGFERLSTKTLGRREILLAKRMFEGSYRLDLQRASAQATMLAINTCFRLPTDPDEHIRLVHKVTASEIKALSNEFLSLDRSVAVTLNPR